MKDHPLSDGNKRSAAALFVVFLSRNGLLAGASGSPPREKELMVALVVRMIAG